MILRAKFVVTEVKEYMAGDGSKDSEAIHAIAVYSPDPENENAQWSKWTPAGQLWLTINNPPAFGTLVQGKEYFLDLTPVEQLPLELGMD